MNRTIAEVCEATGVTPRQVRHWTHQGYLEVAAGGGHGRHLLYTAEEVEVARRMAILLRVGLTLSCAGAVARLWAAHPLWPIYLGDGLTLHPDAWHPEHPQAGEYVAAYRAVHAPVPE
jgi:DNA-binding transcriptional MerR regulator